MVLGCTFKRKLVGHTGIRIILSDPDPHLKSADPAPKQGWKKPGFFLKKPSPVGFWGFFGFFGFFLGFLGFFAQKRGFLGFFQFHEYFKVHPDFKL
jgi:hypothetical protein